MSSRVLERPLEEVVDPRIAARRDAVSAERRRRRYRRLAWLLGVVTLVAGGWYLTRTSLFDVETVEVQGAQRTPADSIRAASGIELGDPLVGLDEGAAATGVEALPWVATATVERNLDGTVRVAVVERVPVATLASPDDGRALVDREGRVLEVVAADGSVGIDPALVAIDGLTAPAPGATLGPAAEGALSVVERLTPGLRSRVTAVGVTPSGELQLRLTPDIVVELGLPTELDAKLASLATALSQIDQTDLATLDLRVPELATATRR